MKDKARFAAAGVLPNDLPPFRHGYSRDNMLWLNEQPSDFYRRELLLHEGTHCFMSTVLHGMRTAVVCRGNGRIPRHAPLARRPADARLHAAQPRGIAYWRRIGIIQDAVVQHRALKLKAVIEYPSAAFLETEPYAWCWAAVTLLDRHPRYQERFRRLLGSVRQRDFNEQFYRLFEPDWQELRQ